MMSFRLAPLFRGGLRICAASRFPAAPLCSSALSSAKPLELHPPKQFLPELRTEAIKKENEQVLEALQAPLKVPPPSTSLNEAFAIVQIGGRQYKVTAGDKIMVEKVDAQIGEVLLFEKVLMVGSKDFTAIGQPILVHAKIQAEVQEHSRTESVDIFKKKRRKRYQRWNSHRQPYTLLHIDAILFDY
mmetsp:Transcript_45212/g.113826  ORF Transcript_45212/g.113826 Transcript_45212/m.113826 type:complete len:187 (+) Transcript_45212:31-591(+)